MNFFFTSAGGKQGGYDVSCEYIINDLVYALLLSDGWFLHMLERRFSGKYYGAGDIEGLHITVRRLFGFGVIMALMFTAVYVFGGVGFLRLLTSDTAVVTAAQPYLFWAYLIPIAGMVGFCVRWGLYRLDSY